LVVLLYAHLISDFSAICCMYLAIQKHQFSVSDVSVLPKAKFACSGCVC
jgi:hypothetical protein